VDEQSNDDFPLMKLAKKPKNVCSTAVKRARPGWSQNETAMRYRLRTVERGPRQHGEG